MNSFDAQDRALCRATSDLIAGDRLDRPYLAQRPLDDPAECLTTRAFELGVHMPADLPLPPSYNEDLAEWLKSLDPASKSPMQAQPRALADSGSAASGAAMVGTKPEPYAVCIKAYAGHYNVGDVRPWSARQAAADHWLDCDGYGWIPHEPRSDSFCPVPTGIAFETRQRDGNPCTTLTDLRSLVGRCWWQLGVESLREGLSNDIVAWRPVAGGSA
jgi:hypothetical protein